MLKGEDMSGIGSGKSLKDATAQDNIFIYFTDHGGPGVICFPGFIELGVNDLMDALQTLNQKKMYNKMVFYMEACESGSMFNNHLKSEWDIYGVTASNPSESSWACDYSSKYESYLNDCWSRDWLNDTRWALNNHQLDKRTLDEQFKWVKIQSSKSPECRYGDQSFVSDVLKTFQGAGASQKRMSYGVRGVGKATPYDVKLRTLEAQLASGKNVASKLQEHKNHRFRMDLRWNAFKKMFGIEMSKSDDSCEGSTVTRETNDCTMKAIKLTKKYCGSFDSYTAQYYKYIHEACKITTPEKIGNAMQEICFVA